MLGKTYSLGAFFENTGEVRVKVANFDDLRTQGQDVATFIEGFTPDPAYMYLHVIAMGAGEYYGCNINGDYFPEHDLIARHKTFETNAKVFKEHDNKPTSPSYGKVAFSWYNPKMHRVELVLAVDKIKGKEFVDRQNRGEQLEVSMGCFPAGTMILMSDGTERPIETVQINQEVITHTGKVHKVVTKMMHNFTGVLMSIYTERGCLRATKNHPILVGRTVFKNFVTRWLEAGEIKVGDVLFCPTSTGISQVTVTDVTSKEVKNLPVFNFSVEEDESYVANSIAVHNCKVAFDICSICGNKAKKSSDYCDHIRHHKKEVFPDGKQAYMINENPTFFDISIVRHRADRIAYVLDKVASASAATMGDYAEDFFDNLGKTIPVAEEPKTFDIEDEFSKTASTEVPKLASAQKLAMIKRIKAESVRAINDDIAKSIPELEKTEPDLPIPMLDTLALNYSFPDILKSLFTRAIALKPREATRIILVQHGLPFSMSDTVMRILTTAKPPTGVIPGDYKRDIGKMVDPFILERSSFLPAILHRIENTNTLEKKAALQLDRNRAYYSANTATNMGTVVYPDMNGVPTGDEALVAFGPGGYKLSNGYYIPVGTTRVIPQGMLERVLAALGTIYTGYRNIDPVTATALDLRNKAPQAGMGNVEKQASVLPFVGTHFCSSNFGNYEKTASDFSNNYVDIIAETAPIVASYSLYKTAGIIDPEILKYPESIEKMASAQDVLINFGTGLIYRPSGQGVLEAGTRNAVEAPIYEHTLGGLTSLVQTHVVPTLLSTYKRFK